MKKIGLLLFFLPLYTQGQIISTVAGCGVAGYFGDGGQATAALLLHPRDVATDNNGNVFFTERENSVVRKVNSEGIISTIAGTGVSGYNGDSIQASSAQVWYPVGLAIDKFGNLYIADCGNARVRKIDTSGMITTIAGTGIAGYNGDSISATSAELGPWCIALDTAGNVFVGENGNHRIRRIDATGIITTIAGDGTAGFTGDGGPASMAQVGAPIGMALDKYKNIYFSEGIHLRKIDYVTGIISTFAGTGVAGFGGDGGPASAAKLNEAEGLSTDDSGNIFVADVGNQRIRKISAAGTICTVAGDGYGGYLGDGGYADTSALQSPTGVCSDSSGKIYIADQGNQRVRCIGCIAKEAIADIASGNNELFSISPNPVTENAIKILVSSQRKEEVKIVLRNEVGQTVRETVITTNKETEWEPDVPNGIYFVQAITGGGSQTKKIVVGFH